MAALSPIANSRYESLEAWVGLWSVGLVKPKGPAGRTLHINLFRPCPGMWGGPFALLRAITPSGTPARRVGSDGEFKAQKRSAPISTREAVSLEIDQGRIVPGATANVPTGRSRGPKRQSCTARPSASGRRHGRELLPPRARGTDHACTIDIRMLHVLPAPVGDAEQGRRSTRW